MKKITLVLSLGILLISSSGAYCQEKSMAKVSIQDKNWQKGGIYEGFVPNQEILEKRNSISKYFKNSNGSITAQVGSLVHYKDANGAWQDIDNSITLNNVNAKGGYKFSNETNEIKSYFPENAGVQTVKMQINENLDFSWWKNPKLEIKNNGTVLSSISAKSQTGIVKNNTIIYNEAYAGISEEFEVLSRGLENNTIIHSLNNQISNSPEGTILEFSQIIELKSGWSIISNGKKMMQNFETDKFSITIPGVEDQLHFSPIVVFDNKISKEEALFLTNSPKEKLTANDLKKLEDLVYQSNYTAEFTENGLKITTTLPVKWLKKSGRAFPVTIDPTVVFGSTATGNFYGPLTHWYGYQRHASLYLQSEIGGYGSITTIEYYKTTAGSDRTKPAKVFMKSTDATALTGTSAWNSTTYTGGLTPNFDGNTTQTTALGWVPIVLTTPFEYTSGNLMIMVTDLYGGSGSVQFMSQVGTGNPTAGRQAFRRVDGTDPGDATNTAVENYLQSIRITYNTLSTDEFEGSKFSYYPNPVKNIFNVTYKSAISTVSVHNMLGQQVLSKSINANQADIDMSGLSSGTYFVKVNVENTTKTIKVIKE